MPPQKASKKKKKGGSAPLSPRSEWHKKTPRPVFREKKYKPNEPQWGKGSRVHDSDGIVEEAINNNNESAVVAASFVDKIFEKTNAKITDIIIEEKKWTWMVGTFFEETLCLTKQFMVPQDYKKDDCYLDPENSWEP